MQIGIVGSGPAVTAVRAALNDEDTSEVELRDIDAAGVGEVAVGVVVGPAGDPVFERANRRAREGETPWLAVELGGVGAQPGIVDAAISGFAPATGCYTCLCTRVASNHDGAPGEEAGVEGDIGTSDDATTEDATAEDATAEDATAEDATTDAATARLAGAIAGHEIHELLNGAESSVLGGVVELPYAERLFLPVPGCACRESRDRSLRRDYDTNSLDEALARAERAFDERVGIVREVGEIDSFPAPYYLARACSTDAFSDATAARQAAGVAAGWDRAFMKALGEALERYSAGVYRTDEFERGAVAGRDDAIAPGAFAGRGDEAGDAGGAGNDTNETTDSDDPSIPWVPGEHLHTGESVSLPAEFVQFPPPERRFGSPITTGLGLGSSGVEALLSGLYEVIERDATMLAWYSTYEPLGLTIEDEAFSELARRAQSEGLAVTPVLVTQDIDVPVISVALHRESWPQFALGSGANLDPAAAARSALAEALQNWMELRRMGHDAAMDAEGEIGHYSEFPEPVRALVTPETEIPATTVGPAEPPTGANELDSVVEAVGEAGCDSYAARLTPRDVAALGFEAVRVVVPRAQPLFTDETVFGERAHTVPDDLGFAPRLDRAFHPYP